MNCTHCGWSKAKSPRGLQVHEGRCPSNPANIAAPESVDERVRRSADAKLAEAERLVRKLAAEDPNDDDVVAAASAFDAYRELLTLLGTA